MKKCELCNSIARIYCESDQASLCWECDTSVHTANFIVAKHSRTLLCHACQSVTPWTGSGPKLAPTVSVCEACANRNSSLINGDRDHENNAEDDSGNEDNRNGRTDVDDGDNQVVPLSLTPLTSPMKSSSSSSEDSSGRYYRGRDRASSSNIAFFSNRTAGTARLSSDGTGKNQENGGLKIRSWAWP